MRFWAVNTAGLAFFLGCTGNTPPSEIAPPDIQKISVFYPADDGLVYGRGLAGAISDSTISHVRVASHPTAGETIVEVDASDGSFTFSVIAISDDILEITAARDAEANERGDPAYLVVPITPLPLPTWVCCGAKGDRKGTCQPEEDRDAGLDCPNIPGVSTECEVDRECGAESGELLPLNLTGIQPTPPNQNGRITLAGGVQANVLVTLENRGKRAFMGYEPEQRRQVTISDENGRFRFDGIPARGDDELILQIRDLNGFRSPEARLMVPDSPLMGLDVIGVDAFDLLTNGERGRIAVLLAPYGEDGRTICPNGEEAPILCAGGGLEFDMVDIQPVQIDNSADANAQADLGTEENPTRGLNGGEDPLQGRQDVVVVLDMSADAAQRDEDDQRFGAVSDFIEGLRSRDDVALVTFGSVVQTEISLTGPGQRNSILGRLDELRQQDGEGGASRVLEGIAHAGKLLTDARRRRPGRIIAVTLGKQPDPRTAEDLAASAVFADPNIGFDGWVVDVVAVGLTADDGTDEMSTIAGFTGGSMRTTASLNTLPQDLADVRNRLAGSFVLLYAVDIPDTAGKVAEVKFTATVTLEGRSAKQDYSGLLRITNAEN